jgi:hypothetical protein
MELLLILVVVAVVGFLVYKNFAPKKSVAVTVNEVAAKAEVVEVKAETVPKKTVAKKAPAKKPAGAKKAKSK